MSSVGPQSPATGGQLILPGNPWDDAPVQASDNTRGACVVGFLDVDGAYSEYIFGREFDFSAIPADSIIDGIKVEWERSGTNDGGGCYDATVKLLKRSGTSPVAVGSNLSAGALWPATDAYESFGGATSLWGTTWTVAEIQDAMFGCELLMVVPNYDSSGETGYVDHVRITVWYHAPASDDGGPKRIIMLM